MCVKALDVTIHDLPNIILTIPKLDGSFGSYIFCTIFSPSCFSFTLLSCMAVAKTSFVVLMHVKPET